VVLGFILSPYYMTLKCAAISEVYIFDEYKMNKSNGH
jgi:hypothetical protein